MKITKTKAGFFVIEPTTSDQEKALEIFLQGLEMLVNKRLAPTGVLEARESCPGDETCPTNREQA